MRCHVSRAAQSRGPLSDELEQRGALTWWTVYFAVAGLPLAFSVTLPVTPTYCTVRMARSRSPATRSRGSPPSLRTLAQASATSIVASYA